MPFWLGIAAPLAHFPLLQFISMATPRMGYLLIILERAVKKDFSRFFMVWSVLALGFGVGLYVLKGVNEEQEEETLYEQWLELYRVTLGAKPYWSSTATTMGGGEWLVLFYVAFTVFSSVVLIRMLISMFNETYNKTRQNAESVWRIERGYCQPFPASVSPFLLERTDSPPLSLTSSLSLSLWLSLSLSLALSTSLSLSTSVCLSVCLSLSLSLSLVFSLISLFLNVTFALSASLCLSIPLSLSPYLSTTLSPSLSPYLPTAVAPYLHLCLRVHCAYGFANNLPLTVPLLLPPSKTRELTRWALPLLCTARMFLMLHERRTIQLLRLLRCFPSLSNRIRDALWISSDRASDKGKEEWRHEYTVVGPLPPHSLRFSTSALGDGSADGTTSDSAPLPLPYQPLPYQPPSSNTGLPSSSLPHTPSMRLPDSRPNPPPPNSSHQMHASYPMFMPNWA